MVTATSTVVLDQLSVPFGNLPVNQVVYGDFAILPPFACSGLDVKPIKRVVVACAMH